MVHRQLLALSYYVGGSDGELAIGALPEYNHLMGALDVAVLFYA